MGMTWIEWFCSIEGNDYICTIPHDFLTDQFNLCGLKQSVENYSDAYKVLTGDILDTAEIESVVTTVVELYSLIHQRYVMSEGGLADMKEKYEQHTFGFCPRYLCNNCPLLPVGLSCEPRQHSVKNYCPSCKDIYNSPEETATSIDGCFFGTSFPMEFLIHFPSFVPRDVFEVYEPKLYGFSIYSESEAYRKGRGSDTPHKSIKK